MILRWFGGFGVGVVITFWVASVYAKVDYSFELRAETPFGEDVRLTVNGQEVDSSSEDVFSHQKENEITYSITQKSQFPGHAIVELTIFRGESKTKQRVATIIGYRFKEVGKSATIKIPPLGAIKTHEYFVLPSIPVNYLTIVYSGHSEDTNIFYEEGMRGGVPKGQVYYAFSKKLRKGLISLVSLAFKEGPSAFVNLSGENVQAPDVLLIEKDKGVTFKRRFSKAEVSGVSRIVMRLSPGNTDVLKDTLVKTVPMMEKLKKAAWDYIKEMSSYEDRQRESLGEGDAFKQAMLKKAVEYARLAQPEIELEDDFVVFVSGVEYFSKAKEALKNKEKVKKSIFKRGDMVIVLFDLSKQEKTFSNYTLPVFFKQKGNTFVPVVSLSDTPQKKS